MRIGSEERANGKELGSLSRPYSEKMANAEMAKMQIEIAGREIFSFLFLHRASG